MQPIQITNPTSFENTSTVNQYYKQLHKTIDDMDIKVQNVIRKHQAEFLFAYRNHIKKIKKELAQIKAKSQQQEKMFSSNDRIQYLQKQLIIFRQEALKLYDKLDAKTQEAQIYKAKIKQTEKDYQDKEREAKELVKSIKLNQAGRSMYELKIQELQEIIKVKDLQIAKLNSKLANRNVSHMSYMSHLSEKMSEKSNIGNNLDQKFSPVRLSTKKKSSSTVNKKSFTPMPLFKNTVHDSQLKDWFLQCIRTVKREIAQRKTYTSGNSPVDLNQISNIDEFRMVDKLRLLELFMQNQKLLVWMYEKIFPDRLSEIKGYLSSQGRKSTPSSNVKMDPDLQIEVDSLPPSNNYLPKVNEVKWKKSEIRNKISIKNGKLNMSSY